MALEDLSNIEYGHETWERIQSGHIRNSEEAIKYFRRLVEPYVQISTGTSMTEETTLNFRVPDEQDELKLPSGIAYVDEVDYIDSNKGYFLNSFTVRFGGIGDRRVVSNEKREELKDRFENVVRLSIQKADHMTTKDIQPDELADLGDSFAHHHLRPHIRIQGGPTWSENENLHLEIPVIGWANLTKHAVREFNREFRDLEVRKDDPDLF